MAITKCEECGQDVAEDAKRCMNCGTEGPILKQEAAEREGKVLLSGGLCAIGVVGSVGTWFFDTDVTGLFIAVAIFGGWLAFYSSLTETTQNIIFGVGLIAVLVFIYFDEERALNRCKVLGFTYPPDCESFRTLDFLPFLFH